MKIAYEHLLNFLVDKPSIKDVSEKLFQLGHEHEIEDSIFDIEFTPNRGDCLSLLGLARDLNVFYNTNLKLKSYEADIPKLELDFHNRATNKCPVISFLNIEIEEEVQDYRDYLENYFKDLNLNKNNFFTDISNYIAYEMGQPTHCYDLNSLDAEITLTDGVKDKHFKTLLGSKISIDESDLVFIRNDEVINLAGVVGSMETSCSKNSKNVLIECAYFSPESIMGKSIKYNLQSDASHKFERGVDPKSHDNILRRFIKIVNDHAKIKSLSIYNNTYIEFEEAQLDNNFEAINKILGVNESKENIEELLSKLNFQFSDKIIVPSYRSDISHQNDLAEEYARVLGYNNISEENFKIPLKSKINESSENNIRQFFIDNGFAEVINYPFSNIANDKAIEVDNPLDSNRRYLRTNIIESLIDNMIYNEKRQKDSIKMFEISDIYSKDIENADKRLSIIVSGRRGHNYKEFNKFLDKNYLVDLFQNLDIDIEQHIFEISRENIDSKIKTKVFGLEIELKQIDAAFEKYNINPNISEKFVQYKPISEFPTSTRDLSFSIENYEKIDEVIQRLEDTNVNNLKDSFMFDFYENVKVNKVKIGYRFVFQAKDKTLTDHEIDAQIEIIIDSILSIDSVSLPGKK
tara:strand:- start:4847 stop:6745 length:1899 start_codon:yes stop_codon:yes gene_type:complete